MNGYLEIGDAVWFIIGTAIGVAIGVTMGNVAVGIGAGAGIGIALMLAQSTRKEHGERGEHEE